MTLIVDWMNSCPNLFIEAVTQARLNLINKKMHKVKLDNYTIRIIYLLLFHLQLD